MYFNYDTILLICVILFFFYIDLLVLQFLNIKKSLVYILYKQL